MNNIHDYLEKLLQQAGFTADDNLEMLIEDLEPVLIDRIISKMAARLGEDDQNHMFNLIEQWNIEGFDAFMHEKIADYDEYFGQVLNEFGKEYLEQPV